MNKLTAWFESAVADSRLLLEMRSPIAYRAARSLLVPLFVALTVVSCRGAQAAEPTAEDLVRGDPAAEAIVRHVQDSYAPTPITVVGRDRYTDLVTGYVYTKVKMRAGVQSFVYTINESSGRIEEGDRLPAYEAEEVLSALPPVYRKMGPDLLAKMRDEQGGVLGGPGRTGRLFDVTFYTDSTGGLDAIQAVVGTAIVERFDAPAIYAARPPVVRFDKSGVAIPAPPAPQVRALSARLPVEEILRVGSLAAVTSIERTQLLSPRLDVSVPRIRADVLRGFGLEGQTAVIGIVDSGIDDKHPDLDPRVITGRNFTTVRCAGGTDDSVVCDCGPGGACTAGICVGGTIPFSMCVAACAAPGVCVSSVDDTNGHGTHVAGIAGSSDEKFWGVAPSVNLINAKAIPGNSAQVEAALNFAEDEGAAVINGSYGAGAECTAPLNAGVAQMCAGPPGCTAPAGNVGDDCFRDYDCDSAPGADDGVCGTILRPCLANGDCDSAAGAGDGSCNPAGPEPIPCVVDADCDVPPGAGNGDCSASATDGQSDQARDVDFQVFRLNNTVTIAAEELPYAGHCTNDPAIPCGNDAPCVPGGGVCVAFPTTPNDAFNVITVGSSNLTAPESTVSASSAVGPTSPGHRSKPDVIAPGEAPGADGIDSTAHNHETGPDFVDKQGTSMAAPHVAGLAALLWDWGTGADMLTDTPYLKAAIVNNCRRLSVPAWQHTPVQPLDTHQGAGEVDAAETFRAYADDLRVWQQQLMRSDAGAPSHWYWLDVTNSAGAETRVVGTLVFERHVTDPAVFAPLLNDLDLRLYDPASTQVDGSISGVDSVEHIVFDPPRDGRYCFEVAPISLAQDDAELYALAAGQPPAGNIRDFRLHFTGTTNPCLPDFGDAPDPGYPTLLASNGARHLDWTKEWLGTSRDEIDGELEKTTLAVKSRVDPFPSVSGEVDAADIDDQDSVVNLVDNDKYDDGVVLPALWRPGVPSPVSVTVQTVVDDTGVGPDGRYEATVPGKRLYLNAWADWNGDGVWAASEKIIGSDSPTGQVAIDPETFGSNEEYTIGEAFSDDNNSDRWEPGEPFAHTVGATETTETFSVTPPAAIAGFFSLRFRLDYGEDAGKVANVSGNLSEDKGAAQFGEVEDYPNRVLDHFLCYGTAGSQEIDVELVDQFDAGRYHSCRHRVRFFCTPADKEREGITDPDTHLKAYRLKGPHVPRTNIEVVNQFGSYLFDTQRTLTFMVPSLKSLPPEPGPPPPDPDGHALDHYRCVSIRPAKGAARFPRNVYVEVDDQFGARIVNLRRPTKLCVPTDKNLEGIKNPDAHLVCYKIKVSLTHKTSAVQVNNQIGPDVLRLRPERELCVPATKILPGSRF